jgi:predicted DNA-binding transcriptional regulator
MKSVNQDSIRELARFRDNTFNRVFLYLLINVHHGDVADIIVKEGQILTTISKISQELDISFLRAYLAVKAMVRNGLIRKEKFGHSLLITINDYLQYSIVLINFLQEKTYESLAKEMEKVKTLPPRPREESFRQLNNTTMKVDLEGLAMALENVARRNPGERMTILFAVEAVRQLKKMEEKYGELKDESDNN